MFGRSGRRGRPAYPDVLTPAEWRVLEHLREGRTNAEIAVRLGISPDGVKFHVSNMLAKLELPDRRALGKWQPSRKPRIPRRKSIIPALTGAARALSSKVALGAAGAAVAAAVTVALGLTLAASGRFSGDPAVEDKLSGVPIDGAVQVIAGFSDGSHAFALHWRTDDELWYVQSPADGSLVLTRYTVSSTGSTTWAVPARANQTNFTFLVEDSKGLLWVGANYTVAAFDPVSQKFVYSATLDHRPAELDGKAAAGSFDGSWITGMAVDSTGTVVLARHNVLALYRLGLAGLEPERMLDRAPTELRVEDGQVNALVRENDQAAVIGEGRQEALKDVDQSGCTLLIGSPGQGSTLSARGKPLATGLLIAPDDPTVVDESAGRAVIAVGERGLILRADCQGQTAGVFGLGDKLVFMDGMPGTKDLERPVRTPRRAESLAVSPSGTIAAGLSTNEVIIIH